MVIKSITLAHCFAFLNVAPTAPLSAFTRTTGYSVNCLIFYSYRHRQVLRPTHLWRRKVCFKNIFFKWGFTLCLSAHYCFSPIHIILYVLVFQHFHFLSYKWHLIVEKDCEIVPLCPAEACHRMKGIMSRKKIPTVIMSNRKIRSMATSAPTEEVSIGRRAPWSLFKKNNGMNENFSWNASVSSSFLCEWLRFCVCVY